MTKIVRDINLKFFSALFLFIFCQSIFAENEITEFRGARVSYGSHMVSFFATSQDTEKRNDPRGHLVIQRNCRLNLLCVAVIDVHIGSLFSFNGHVYLVEDVIEDLEMRQRMRENSREKIPVTGLFPSDVLKFSRHVDKHADQDTDSYVLEPGKSNAEFYGDKKSTLRIIVTDVFKSTSGELVANIQWQIGDYHIWYNHSLYQLRPEVEIFSRQVKSGDEIDFPLIGKLKVSAVLAKQSERQDGGVVLTLD